MTTQPTSYPAPAPLEAVFATTFLYAACKVVGNDAWPDYLKNDLAHPADSVWPAVRTLAYELSSVCDAELVTDASTYIDRARCVMAGRFLASSLDVWITCDDDVYADAEVLRTLIRVCRATRGGVAVPYMNRDGRSMTFRRVKGPTEWLELGEAMRRAPVRVVDRVGFGLVALHRELVEALAFAPSTKWFRESERSRLRCPHLFVNGVEDETFIGEDYSFSKLAEEACRPLRVLLEAPAEHAGILAMLDHEGHIRVADPERAAVLDTALREAETALAGQPTEREGA
ncbi:MAG: hypothetical protein KGK07_13630 [Chloroflexota bacterium]|nr:hypothetical protein [Chloroflexota bacterium]